jgi:hypothetical protein
MRRGGSEVDEGCLWVSGGRKGVCDCILRRAVWVVIYLLALLALGVWVGEEKGEARAGSSLQ